MRNVVVIRGGAGFAELRRLVFLSGLIVFVIFFIFEGIFLIGFRRS